MILGALVVRRWLAQAQGVSPTIEHRAEALGRRLGLRSSPKVREHPLLAEPCLCGVWRPSILLPGRWLLKASQGELDAVLAHELAHARRLDPCVNLLQRLIESCLFFHPSVRWLSRALRIERELCTDALAVQATGDPLSLALALESVARLRLEGNAVHMLGSPGLSLGGDGLTLYSRIQELIGMKPTGSRLSIWSLVALPLAGVLALVAVDTGNAQEPIPAASTSSKVVEQDLVTRAGNLSMNEKDQTKIVYDVSIFLAKQRALDQMLGSKARKPQACSCERTGVTQFSTIGSKKVEGLLSTLKAEKSIDMLSSPTLMVLDGRTASVQIRDVGNSAQKNGLKSAGAENQGLVVPNALKPNQPASVQKGDLLASLPDGKPETLISQIGVKLAGKTIAEGVRLRFAGELQRLERTVSAYSTVELTTGESLVVDMVLSPTREHDHVTDPADLIIVVTPSLVPVAEPQNGNVNQPDKQ